MTPEEIKIIQTALGVKADGKLGPVSIKALQKKLGVKQDGKMGPVTAAALQRQLGVPVDGKIGPITAAAVKAKGAVALTQPPGFHVPALSTLKFDPKKLAAAGLGLVLVTLFAIATKSGRYA
jgi:lysozyme family protein